MCIKPEAFKSAIFSPVNINQMREFIADKHRIFVLSGAGISANSGIPTYRDHRGRWQRSDPIKHLEFLHQPLKRQRYWARSMVGWQHVQLAKPNVGHIGLATLESFGQTELLVTQNVDGLHQRAGSRDVIDLHGRLDRVVCLDCEQPTSRADMQAELEAANPALVDFCAQVLPDGDADIDDYEMSGVEVPACMHCGGILKPDVVFFGDNVPRERVERAMQALERADAVLVVGSSLQVYSGYRFCRAAAERDVPIACINFGSTRADGLFSLKLEMDCGEAMQKLGLA